MRAGFRSSLVGLSRQQTHVNRLGSFLVLLDSEFNKIPLAQASDVLEA